MDLEFIQQLVQPADTKIVLLVLDGLGGLARDGSDQTELAVANTPNLDALAAQGCCGLHEPVGPGITPGSGPGHISLFGYDPIKYEVGRGVLSALGVGFDLQKGDVAARGNFCTLDDEGLVTDRRAGRISTELNEELCALLRENVSLPGVEVFVQTIKEHRFLLVLRGEGLSGELADTDPQRVGRKPLAPKGESAAAEKTVELVADFLEEAQDTLADQHPANMVLLRGFSQRPDWPDFDTAFGLKAAAIAAYPMYRGVAKLVGMDVFDQPHDLDEEFALLKDVWDDYDFFFVHAKKVDSRGEDGDFDAKVAVIEQVDRYVEDLMALGPDVVIATGDHSTPATYANHSWHPVPVVIWSKWCRADGAQRFTERECLAGALGTRFPGKHLMTLALANALRLKKFGA